MSYILDALRKAAAERERSAKLSAPMPINVVSPAPQTDDAVRKTKFWFYVALGIVLVLTIALVWLLGTRLVKTQPAAQPTAATSQENTPKQVIATATTAPGSVPDAASVSTPIATPTATPDTPALPATPQPHKIQVKPSTALPTATQGKASIEVISPKKTDTPHAPPSPLAPRVYAVNELPDNIRANLPKLTISGASFSENPVHRMLIANGQVYRETEDVAPGLQVARISEKEVIFKFQGYQYSQSYP